MHRGPEGYHMTEDVGEGGPHLRSAWDISVLHEIDALARSSTEYHQTSVNDPPRSITTAEALST